MKIQLISDLHQEFWRETQPEDFVHPADVLIIAGDLAVGPKVTELLEFYKSKYEHVIYVPGNHEHYTYDKPNPFLEHANHLIPPGVNYMNPGCTIINDVVFIGATLWTNFREDLVLEAIAKRGIRDFRFITTSQAKNWFYRDSEYIKHIYEQTPGKKKVIITHFMPAEVCISPYWRVHGGMLNGYFANNLDSWIEELDDTVWFFGHTHDRVEAQLGSTKLISNPYGYERHETTNARPFFYEI